MLKITCRHVPLVLYILCNNAYANLQNEAYANLDVLVIFCVHEFIFYKIQSCKVLKLKLVESHTHTQTKLFKSIMISIYTVSACTRTSGRCYY